MSDLLAVVTRNRDDIEDIEEYVAREQGGADADPTAPRVAGAERPHARADSAHARVIVVGAGVIGLSCAVRLMEAGHRVDVLARDLPLETTSVDPAGLWYPYRASRGPVGLIGRRTPVRERPRDPERGAWPGTEVLAAQADPVARGVAGLDRAPIVLRRLRDGWTFTSSGRRHAGLPALADRRASRSSVAPHPAQPLRACRPTPTSSSTAPDSAPGYLAGDPTVTPVAGQVVVRRAVRPRALVARPGRADVRHPARARRRRRRHRQRRGVEPYAVARHGGRDPRARRRARAGAGAAPGAAAQGRAAPGTARRSGWSGSATSCTATGTAEPA